MSATALLGAATLLLADVERPCVGGTHVVEAWGSIPADGIQLDLARGEGSAASLDTRPFPGWGNSAPPPSPGCGWTTNRPAEQSMSFAAAAWNNATIPGSSQPATSFLFNETNITRFGTYPTANPGGTGAYLSSSLMVTDGRNTVTFWEPPTYWALFGTTSLAVADVVANGATIIEGDIAFNTTSESASTGVPLFRFIEDNQNTGTTITTMSRSEVFNGNVTLANDPIIAWADMQGVMTHELGHLAGLGHSLVDGPTSPLASQTPTMFAVAQVQPFTGPVALQPTCGAAPQVPVSGANTIAGGLLGRPARTLEADDVAAISVAYPGPAQAQLGSISGTIFDASAVPQPVRAAHVVAIDASDPNVRRIGSFSDTTGSFEVGSLLPGTYYLLVEEPDASGYFMGTQMPEIADPSFPCGSGLPSFRTEFYDVNESANEAQRMAASMITVSAGATTSVGDIFVEPVSGLQLASRACSGSICSAASRRGSVQVDLAGASPTVSMELSGGIPSGSAIFALGVDHLYAPFGGQVIEVNALPGGMVTFRIDASGSATLTLPVGPANLGQTFYGQAAQLLPSGAFEVTNTVAIRLEGL